LTVIGTRRLAGALLVLALAAGCEAQPVPPTATTATPTAVPPATASPIASPWPSGSLAPSGSPSAGTPKARTYGATGEIGDVRFAPDGRIVLVERDWVANVSRVVALDQYGSVLPGWPWTQGDTGNPIAMAELGPDGSVYVAVRGAVGSPQTYTWTLHRLDAEARELAGFPVALPDVPFCGLAVGPDGTAYLICEGVDATTAAGVTSVRAIRPDGSTANGWPVVLHGGGTIDGFRPDGAVVITTVDERGWRIAVIRPDGTSAPGWPRGAPVGGSVVIDGGGRIHVTSHAWSEGQCGPATRTTYTVLRKDGTRVPGWPVTLRGWASEPLVADDGSMTVLTRNGRAIRYSRSGKVVGGWPVTGVGVSVGCYSGSVPVSAGKDGVVVVGDGQATRLTNTGRIARGWPVDLPYKPAITCPSCTPGPAGPLAPAIGERGIYVAGYRRDRPRLMVLARDGSLPKGRQKSIGKTGDDVEWVRIAPTGRVWMLLSRWSNETQSTSGLLVPIAADRPLED
jgi:hypothetical protein